MISSMSSGKYQQAKTQQGFSLIEMAVVLVILGALLGGILMPLSSQREVSQRQAAERQLQEIRNALIGFAQVNNRLPCPTISGAGALPSVAGACGAGTFVPYAAIGIQGTIINGNLVDVWQQPIIYRLVGVVGPAPAATTWIYARTPIPSALLVPAGPQPPYFRICPAGGACPICPGAPCAVTSADATSVVAVVISAGDNDHTASADELQNALPASTNFVRRTLTQNFNDLVVWISQPTLIYEVSRAGQ